MNAIATGGGVSKGPMMVILKQYVALADPEDVEARLKDWELARDRMRQVASDLGLAGSKLPEAFEETSLTTAAAGQAFRESATELNDKADQLDSAIKALSSAQTITRRAKQAEAQLAASLPSNHAQHPIPRQRSTPSPAPASTPLRRRRIRRLSKQTEPPTPLPRQRSRTRSERRLNTSSRSTKATTWPSRRCARSPTSRALNLEAPRRPPRHLVPTAM